jgi:hypothetical protein
MRESRPGSIAASPDSRVNRLSLSVAVILAGLLGAVVAAAVIYFGWRLIVRPSSANRLGSTNELFELVKIGLAVTAGVGGLVALVVALRRQRVTEAAHHLADAADQRDSTRLLNDRFVAASNLLGNEHSAAVRLAGVYAMASLADDWAQQRQTCIDVLCAYTRLPYDPTSAPTGETEVRRTILSVVREHLSHEAAVSWRRQLFDFSGSTVDGGSLDGIRLDGSRILFTGAKFVSGELSFREASLASGSVDFSAAEFDGGSVSFDRAMFRGAEVSFERAAVTSGMIGFVRARFLDGRVEFKDCRLDGGIIDLTTATFAVNLQRETRSLLSFEGSDLRAGTILFHEINRDDDPAEQHKSSESGPSYLQSVSFYAAKLLGTKLDFRSARLRSGQRISFQGVVLDGSDIDSSRHGLLGAPSRSAMLLSRRALSISNTVIHLQ